MSRTGVRPIVKVGDATSGAGGAGVDGVRVIGARGNKVIRSTSDRGILAVLDNRITTKSYGKLFMDSLPDYEVTNDIEKLSEFMAASS